MDFQVPAEHQEAKDFLVLRVLKELPDFQVMHSKLKFCNTLTLCLQREKLKLFVLLPQDQQEILERVERLVVQEIQEDKVHKVYLDPQDSKGPEDFLDHKVPQDYQEPQEHREILDHPVLWVVLEDQDRKVFQDQMDCQDPAARQDYLDEQDLLAQLEPKDQEVSQEIKDHLVT